MGLILLLIIAVSLPAAFGASKIRWSDESALKGAGQPPPPFPRLTPEGIPAAPLQIGLTELVSPRRPSRVDPHLVIPSTVDFHLDIPISAPADGEPRLVGRLQTSLAFASDPARKLLFSAGGDGSLHWFDEETLRPVGRCVLPGVAYQLVCDSIRGKLYAALSAPNLLQFGPLNDRYAARGDIHVFDLERLLAQTKPTAPVEAERVISCNAHVWAMQRSPDGRSLIYLTETPRNVQVVRVDFLDRHEPDVLEMRIGGVHALATAPGGKTLYGLAGGRLFSIDVDTWSLQWSVLVGANVVDLAPGATGQVYLIERRHSLFLITVDLETRTVVSRCALGLEGRPTFRHSSDGRRVFFSNSAVTSGHILAFDITGNASSRPRLVGWSRSDRSHLVRGGIRLTDDDRFLLTGVGQLFRVGS